MLRERNDLWQWASIVGVTLRGVTFCEEPFLEGAHSRDHLFRLPL